MTVTVFIRYQLDPFKRAMFEQYSKNWLSHEELMKGATLKFEMSSQPNKQRGTDEKDFPYSYSTGYK